MACRSISEHFSISENVFVSNMGVDSVACIYCFLIFVFVLSVDTKLRRPLPFGAGGKNNNRRRASIPGGSAHTAGIHLQSSVQRVAGQKVRGRRGMLLDVRRMRSLSGIHSKLRVWM
jgi:hypothetical protein